MFGKALFVATVYTHLRAFHIPFMKHLGSLGYEVHAAAALLDGDEEEAAAAGVKCWDIPFARSATSLRNVTAYRELRALLKRHSYDLIHVHTPAAAWLGRLAARRTGQGPVLYTAHGFHFYKGAPWHYWLLFYLAERLAVRWTDGLVVMNSEDFERAEKMGFKGGEDLFFVHGVGVDLTRYGLEDAGRQRVQADLDLGPEDLVVTCVAEFTPTKNHRFLLSAWTLVHEKVPTAHLLLVGDGRLLSSLEQKALREGLPNVHFLGFRRDVPRILQATDVAVLTSKREGLPRSIMEAMATGRPVVAANVRGIRDLVKNEVTGLLVQLGDVPGLANAITQLLRDGKLRQQMGRAGQMRVRDYSLHKVLAEMRAIYARYLRIDRNRTGSGSWDGHWSPPEEE